MAEKLTFQQITGIAAQLMATKGASRRPL